MISVRAMLFSVLFVAGVNVFSQKCDYWQQKVDYSMKIKMDAKNHRYKGFQHLVYYNNSPDTIDKVFYHLYYNAFQPGSMMDIRARSILDPSMNMDSTISHLSKDEIGFEKINILKQCGAAVKFEVIGTILKAKLNRPLLPGDSTCLDMVFDVQIPKMCRGQGETIGKE